MRKEHILSSHFHSVSHAVKMSHTTRDRLARLRPIFSSTSVRTDEFLKHTSRLLTTSGGIDNAIGTILFTATFLHSQLTRLLEKRYEKLALAIASKASQAVLPGETIVASIEAPESKLSRTCAGLKTLAGVSADVWMFLRLFGLFHIYRWASEFYETQHRDAIMKLLVWMQIGSAALFQVLENIAYLASKGVLNGGKWEKRVTSWMAISSRFWIGQVVLEGLRLLRVRQLNWNEEFGAEKKDDDGEIKVQSEALKKRWRRDFYGNAGWLPLTLHLSYEDENDSPVPEVWQGVGGLVPSVLGLIDAWKETS
jgi:hypothetical protein